MSAKSPSGISRESLHQLLRQRLRTARQDDAECEGLVSVSLALSGEASPESLAEAGEHIRRCDACQQTVREWQSTMHASPATQRAPRRWFSWLQLRTFAYGMAGLIVVVGATVLWRDRQSQPSHGELMMKGTGDVIYMAVERGAQRFRLGPGQTMQDGDRLGFFYSAFRSGYLAVLSVSQNGEVGALYPLHSAESAGIAAGTQLPLPDGGIFAKRAACEWVVGVFSDQPFSIAQLSSLARTAALSSGGDCRLPLFVPDARTVTILR